MASPKVRYFSESARMLSVLAKSLLCAVYPLERQDITMEDLAYWPPWKHPNLNGHVTGRGKVTARQ